ncbi:MAG: ISNCY family transposase [Candidatus Eisenbacteria bacterium]|nr:MAG: ISNCY family transposase [Candidatus Eisenbacteria bacterium]
MILRPTPQERAMKVKDVMVRALAGELSWLQAADLVGMNVRSMRRWRRRLETWGMEGLVDRRFRPSSRKVPGRVIAWILGQYKSRYQGFNVRHFHAVLKREHGFRYSYSFVRQVLQHGGLVKTMRPRGRHRLRREPRAMFGELLHIDGSVHRWLARSPEERASLITIVDDATKQLLYAQLAEAESTATIMEALTAVFRRCGLAQALYSDRASWAAHTPVRNEPVDRTKITQVGRALKRLGIEHILAYSPQARGRSERVNRTLQDRLVNELRIHGIRTIEGANRYIADHFLPGYNLEFGRAPSDPASAFVSLGSVDLNQILCFEEERVVQKDNTVGCEGLRLQVPKQRGRTTCAGLSLIVRRHLDQSYSVWRGTQRIAMYDSRGRLPAASKKAAPPTPNFQTGEAA